MYVVLGTGGRDPERSFSLRKNQVYQTERSRGSKGLLHCDLHLDGRHINKVFWSRFGIDILERLQHLKKGEEGFALGE